MTLLMRVDRAPASEFIDSGLQMPKPGDHKLRILSPNLLELVLVNTKNPSPARVDSWDWVNDDTTFVAPPLSAISVLVNGQSNHVTAVGFKRRPLYAPLQTWDLRIINHLYLRLGDSISPGQFVVVTNNGTLWPTNMQFAASADPLRHNPAIHVNHEGYLPSYPKKAKVGYYLGSMGEMPIPTNSFALVTVPGGATVFDGMLTPRPDVGYTYTPAPYQQVWEADFSGFTVPGEYRLMVPGMGASLPFRIDEGAGMVFARTYALGLFHQRSGYDVAMPFTRFTHAADHMAPAGVPTNASPPFAFTWATIANYAGWVNWENPPQTAPPLTNPAAQLYPFVRPGPVDASGGHFEAGNYSRVTWNSAQSIHILMFAVDSLPGVAVLDNLGVPESGDGISDVLQEAKWEADWLVKMQDSDGGFYYSTYPIGREYEFDVLPEDGDPEVVWPKNTSTTAAAVAALAQCASSPAFKQAYPQAASNYWARALLGWQFLTNAIAIHGLSGAYQRLMHFGDDFTDRDDLAWAACEMFLATGDTAFRTQLEAWFPDPTDPATARWGWWRMYASYGNAIRSYAGAVGSGRLQEGQLNAGYLAKCINAITNCGNDTLRWSQENAYGTSFPDPAKRLRNAGWYFSAEQAFDLVVAHRFHPNPAYLDAILRNLNFEAGCNPVNVAYVTGLGWKRQRQLVDLYSYIHGRTLPKSGIPIGNIQEGFYATWTYGYELGALCFPADGAAVAPYPFYDRWGDAWNVSTEASTSGMVRGFAATAWLAAQTALANQPWRSTNAVIAVPAHATALGQPVTVTLQVADPDLSGARIVWEARQQEPAFGGVNFTFTPVLHEGAHWVEAEVQWPDGRRAFARNSVTVTSIANAPAILSAPRLLASGEFSFQLNGVPQATYLIQASPDMAVWDTISTNVLPASGAIEFTEIQNPAYPRRFYRALKLP